MGIWVLLQPRETGRGRKCTNATFACPEEPSKSCCSQRTTQLTSYSFQPALHTVTKSMKVALFCSCTSEMLYSLLLAQAFSLSGQVTASSARCSPPVGPALLLPSWPNKDAGITFAPGEEGTVQPGCYPSEVLCSAVSLPSLSLAFLQSRWWEVT